jgi:hypothetical protein
MANVTFTPQQSQTYLANNADVLNDATARARAAGIPVGPQFQNFVNQVAQEHFNAFGKDEGRQGVPQGAVELANAPDTSTGASQTFNLTAPPPPDPVDLSPVTSAVQGVSDRIGTAGTGQTDLFAGQAGIMSGQQGIRDVVDPLGGQIQGVRDVVDPLSGQITGIGTQIGTAAEGQAPTLMGQTAGLATGQAGIQAGIGQAGEGQTDLFAGQAGLAGGQATLSENQAALQAGQTGLGTQIGALGTAAVTDPDTGEVTQKPTGLFAGQAGLMAGQTGLGTQLTGVGRDITAELGDVSSRLGGQIGRFQSGVEQYQRGATTQRGDIQGTQRAGQANLLQQIQGVGQQANRAAEAIAQQRQMQTQTQQPAVQQQAAQFAASAPRATPSNQQVGPMGPMASDPRDVLIQNLLRNASLMNRRPV